MNFTDTIDLIEIDDLELVHSFRGYRNRIRINPFDIYDEDEFLTKYRFTKSFMNNVINLIRNDLPHDPRGGSLNPQLQVLLALRCWSRNEIQGDTADLHGVSQQVVSKTCKNVAEALAKKANIYIRMPISVDEQETTLRKFRNIAQFPKVIGAIDCSHIKIKRVGGDNSEAYINRKGCYSLNVQVVCDADLRIRDVVARWRGSVHDSRIFNESSLKLRFERGEFYGRLLGDSGYSCTPYLFTPILNPNNQKEEAYNRAHIRTRNTVERCFGVWKQRFRCLLKGFNTKLSTAKTTIIGLAVLHNMAIDMKENIINFPQVASEPPVQYWRPQDSIRGNIIRRQFIQNNF